MFQVNKLKEHFYSYILYIIKSLDVVYLEVDWMVAYAVLFFYPHKNAHCRGTSYQKHAEFDKMVIRLGKIVKNNMA